MHGSWKYKMVQLLWASLIAQSVKNLPAVQKTWVRLLGWEDPLEKEMATHSSILAWRIPWIEEPGRLQSMGSQESDTIQRLNHHHHHSCWGEASGFLSHQEDSCGKVKWSRSHYTDWTEATHGSSTMSRVWKASGWRVRQDFEMREVNTDSHFEELGHQHRISEKWLRWPGWLEVPFEICVYEFSVREIPWRSGG